MRKHEDLCVNRTIYQVLCEKHTYCGSTGVDPQMFLISRLIVVAHTRGAMRLLVLSVNEGDDDELEYINVVEGSQE